MSIIGFNLRRIFRSVVLLAGLALPSVCLMASGFATSGQFTYADWPWYDTSAVTMLTANYSASAPATLAATPSFGKTNCEWIATRGDGLQWTVSASLYSQWTTFSGTIELELTYAVRPGVTEYSKVYSITYQNGTAVSARAGSVKPSFKTGTGIIDTLTQWYRNRLITTGDPVQLASGAEAISRTLFKFNGARNWDLTLRYNSLIASGQQGLQPLGNGWTHNFTAYVAAAGGNVVVHSDDLSANTFTPVAGNSTTYTSTGDAARYDTLVQQADGSWLLTHRDQSSLLFNSSGQLVEDRDANGHKLVLSYNGSGLSLIRDPVSGTQLSLGYDGNGRLASFIDGTGAGVSLGYFPSGNFRTLTSITNQRGKVVTFGYDGSERQILTVSDDASNVLVSNTYDADNRIVSQDDGVATNQQMTVGYAEQGMPGSTVYAPSDTQQLVPIMLSDPQFVRPATILNSAGDTVTYGYDAAGHIISATVNGQTTTLAYDSQGNAVSVTDPSGATTPILPQVVTTVADRNGKITVHTFDPNANEVSVKDALNHVINRVFDAANRVTSVSDELNRTSSFTYDANGNLLTVTDPAGKVTTNTYDTRNNLLTTTDPLNHVTTCTYDSNNNLLTVTDALGRTTTWTYDGNSLPLTMTLPRGGVYHYTYTAGQLTQVNDPNGVATSFDYDANGRLQHRTDALGKVTAYTYDPAGNLLTVTNPLSQTITYGYDYRNRVTSRTEPTGAVTTYTYDNNSNVLTSTDALGKVTTYAYDGEDRLQTIKDALNRTTTYAYDDVGRVHTVTDPAGNVSTFEYDAAGQIAAVVDALGKRTTTAYDVRGLLTGITDPLGRSSSFTYDNLGRRSTAKDALNRQTGLAYDALNRLQQVTDPGSLVAQQGFDNDGNLISVTNPANAATAFAYDLGDRLTSTTTAAGHATSLAYDVRSLVSTVTQPSTHATTLAYDDAARLSGTTDLVGTISLTRDADGRVLTVTEGSKTLTRVYDALGRLTSYTDGDGNVIGYGYDDIGRLTTLTYPDSRQVAYTYDTAGRLSTVTDWASRVTTYSYDAVGRVTQVLRPNGTKQTRLYDEAGQLTQVHEFAPDGTTLIYSGDHTYDLAGQLTGETLLPSINTVTTAAAQTFDADNRLLTHNGAAATFDPDGNLLSVATGLLPSTYTYDARNRLTSAGALSYTYDAENRRVALTDATGTTRFAINPNAVLDQVLVRTAPDGTKTFYVYGLGLLHEEAGGVAHFYHTDRRGDTIALTDATGTVTDRASYGVYGELLSRTGTTNTPFLFNGKWGVQTDANGIYYHRARYYHPQLRRFLNQDTVLGSIGTNAGLNRFAYANGQPVTSVDPMGLSADDSMNAMVGSAIAGGAFGPMRALGAAASTNARKGGCDDAPNNAGGGVGTAALNGAVQFATRFNQNLLNLGQNTVNALGAAAGYLTNLADPGTRGTTLTATGQEFKALGSAQAWQQYGNYLASPQGLADTTFAIDLTLATGLKGTNCFPAGTKVSTSHGDENIEDIKVGDLVYAYDFEAEKVVESHVLETPRHFTYNWMSVTVDGETIRATRGHRFWVESEKRWIEAVDLKAGMTVRLSDGRITAIAAVSLAALAASETTYNLEIERVHTYFVGEHHVLVHNPTPDFIVTPGGVAFPVPTGATGPTPTRSSGFMFTGGSGGANLDPAVTGVRFMDRGPTVTYMNSSFQSVNPGTGQTLAKTDPLWHIDPANPPCW